MSEDRSDRREQIWQRVRQAILDAVSAVLGPPPPEVVQQIDEIFEEAKRDWEENEECRDEADEIS